MADATYAPPRFDWLIGEFDHWFRQSLNALGIAPYVPEAGDCDDYAALYVALAKVCHRRMPGCAGTALPIGFLHYVSANGPHAVVVAITSDVGLVVLEPQIPGKLLDLTQAERKSAWLLVI
jgi:predicted transglutaminase-like cysteine proteinase